MIQGLPTTTGEKPKLDFSSYFDNFRNMKLEAATVAFQALSHETRLRAFRLIVEAGTDGLAAGEIARALDVPASTLSTHLAILERAELVSSKRVHRSILYAVDGQGIRAVIDFLTRDCCRGAPELCGLGVSSQPMPADSGINNEAAKDKR